MTRRDVFVGVVILLGAIYWANRPAKVEIPTSQENSAETKIEKAFNITIPEDLEKIELKDVSGFQGSGLATREFLNGRFNHMVLVDLPDPEKGSFYAGWLMKGKEGEKEFAFISTGKMKLAKGGWLLEFESKTDYTKYDQVVVTMEKIADKSPEKHVLEGSF